VEIVVTGRHTEVPERFRRHLEEKLAKVTQLAPRVQRLDVVVSHEPNRRQSKACDRVEITCLDRGPVVRAEACADDPYAALDVAVGKLFERLRRMRDRKRVHRGRRAPEGLSEVSARAVPVDGSGPDSALAGPLGDAEGAGAAGRAEGAGGAVGAEGAERADGTIIEAPAWDEGESPVLIREKTHAAVPMSLDQALYEMELVGHDFFLFVDGDAGVPSVVYRRRGWSYGVIRLDPEAADGDSSAAATG
jgi:ribosomal subunit interface protein